MCILLHTKAKNHETQLVLVGFEQFQHRSLFYYQFASVGTGDAVGWATTGGEWGWGGLGDACARIFSLAMVSVAVGKAVVDGWTREPRRMMPLDVGRRMGEVWSALV